MTRARRFGIASLLAFAIAGALWPSLRWVELSNGSEQLVAAAALESQRDGSWPRRLVPTLNENPRLRKPPPATWLGMLVVPTSEARALATGPINDSAYAWAAVKMRTIALLAGVLMLLGTFALAGILTSLQLRDENTNAFVPLVALAICGSTFFWIEQSIRLTTDIALAACVVWANVGLAAALLRGRWWTGLAGAGIAIGLSILVKGPVGLVQTALPALAILPFLRGSCGITSRSRGAYTGAIALGTTLCIAIALPWFLYVLRQYPEAREIWFQEVARTDEEVPPSKPWAFLAFFGLVVPWTPFIVLGLLTGLTELARRLGARARWLRRGRSFARLRGPGMVYALLMILVPLAIMLLVRDKKDRYLLPLLPPACILAAEAVRLVFRDQHRRPTGAMILFSLHHAILLAFCIGVPIAMMLLARDEYVDDIPWLATTVAVPLAVGGGFLWIGSLLAHRRLGQLGFVTGTVTCVLFAANVFLAGYSNAREAQADLKPIAEAVRRVVPSASLWHAGEGPLPPDLPIYAGRPVRAMPREDLGQLDPSTPHVWVVRQRRSDVDPEPAAPPGFRLLTTARRDRSIWWAFVREPLPSAN